MTAESFTNELNGTIGFLPRTIKIVTTDTFAEVTAAGWLVATDWYAAAIANGFELNANDIFLIAYGSTSADAGMFTLGADNILIPSSLVDGIINASNSSATPSAADALAATMDSTVSVMTSGYVAGVNGVASMVGASGGAVNAVRGTVVATGTISSNAIVAAIAGILNVTGATINAGTVTGIYAEWGAAAGTATDLTKCHGFMFVNASANKLNSQIYLSGNATYLLEIPAGTTDYEAAAGTSAGSAGNATHCAAQEVIAIRHNGATKYIPVFTQNT